MLVPTTGLGRRSTYAATVFVVLMAVFSHLVASGQRGGDHFFSNLWLTVPVLGAFAAGVAAFVLGAAAISTEGERSIVVGAVTLLGLLVTAFGVAEIVLPH